MGSPLGPKLVNIFTDKPGAPKAPTVSDVFKTEATLSWQPPAEDGGSPVIGYNVERALAQSSRWLKLNKTLIEKLTYSDKVSRCMAVWYCEQGTTFTALWALCSVYQYFQLCYQPFDCDVTGAR